MQKIHLFIIDPQADFCYPTGSLYVPGANEDMIRLASMIDRIGGKISKITVTLDSHHTISVAHPTFWINSNGKNPSPFTIISSNDIKNGIWEPYLPSLTQRMINYTQTLEKNGKFQLCIWPPHCLIGSSGQAVHNTLHSSLINWEASKLKNVEYINKGNNLYTENYSAIQAEVPDTKDISTQINTPLINSLLKADTILIAGEASSHCVNLTVMDICDEIKDNYFSKILLLTDAMSPVVGFKSEQEKFFEKIFEKGCKLSKTIDFLN